MKTIFINGWASDEPGSVILREHLQDLGHRVARGRTENYDVAVCWGNSNRAGGYKDCPTLNNNVNMFNKYEAMLRFQKAGVLTPTIFFPDVAENNFKHYDFPWFSRKFSHKKGQDIRVCQTQKDVRDAIQQDTDFFSVYVPNEAEFRVWVFKGKAFAVYQKHYRDPGIENYKRMEYRSELRADLLRTESLTKSAIESVKAVKIDFGAVGALYGNVSKDYILEVNSMPDISSMIRVSGIRLAGLVSQWAESQ